MPLNLEVDDEQVELLKEFYSTKANEINASISKLQTELQKITPMLIQLGLKTPRTFIFRPKPDSPSQDFLNGDYSPNFTWEQKAMYILNKRGELTAKQIVDIISDEYEPGLDKIRALNSLPATMSVSASNGKFNRIRSENGEYVYSLPSKE